MATDRRTNYYGAAKTAPHIEKQRCREGGAAKTVPRRRRREDGTAKAAPQANMNAETTAQQCKKNTASQNTAPPANDAATTAPKINNTCRKVYRRAENQQRVQKKSTEL
jgi:hypothetical protein